MRWATIAAMYDGNLPATTAELYSKRPQSLRIVTEVCNECCTLADGGETLFGSSLPKTPRGDGFVALKQFIDELKDDPSAGARLAEQFIVVLLLWLFPDFANAVGCPAEAFINIERDLFGEQRRGKSGARSSVVRPALHPIELWEKYAARPLVE